MKTGILIIIGLTMIACKSKPPQELHFEGVSWEQSSWKEMKIYLTCSLYNPNSKKLNLKNTDLKLIVEGVEIGTLSSSDNISLTGLKRTHFDALLHVKPLNIVRLTPVFALKRKYNLRIEGLYQVSGKKLGFQQNLEFNPASEAYKGLSRILERFLDKEHEK